MVTSRRVTLASRPQNQVALSDFGSDEVELPPLQDGEFLMNVEYLSIDPTIRGMDVLRHLSAEDRHR